MRRLLFALTLLIGLSLYTNAQFPGGGQRPGGGGGQAPNGRLYGKVVDNNNKAVEAASVTLVTNKMDSATKKPKEVIVGGMLTSGNGEFSIDNVPVFGRYKLRITGIGFKAIEQNVGFEMPNRNATTDPMAMLGALDKDLGNIKLQIDEQQLSGVTVTSSRPQLQLGVDRKIFNVDRNITSAGGSALDVMRQVPSVNVDVDGNVTVRNAAPQIFVDGRPTNLTLEQIPADAIESIEIITNPSAKYDASGGVAGILNIVLKKNRRVGYSGNLRANIDSRARFGLGGDINVRQSKINVFANANYNQRKSISTGFTNRLTTFPNFRSSTNQTDRNVSEGYFMFFRGGFDYFLDNRNTITINGNYVRGQFEPENINRSANRTDSTNGITTTNFNLRTTNTLGRFINRGGQISYKHNFPRAGKELTSDFTYNRSSNNNGNFINSEFFNFEGGPKVGDSLSRQAIQGMSENMVFQIDFVNPLNDKTKFEAGVRTNFRRNEQVNNFFGIEGNAERFLASLSSSFNSKEYIHAGYVNFSKQLKNFNYQLGLRAESSTFDGTVPGKQPINIDYPLSLFPSVFLSQKLGNDQDLQVNYSRRINRPNFFQLFPFVDISDSLNIQRGNPTLQPEFTNSIELSYSKIFKNRDNFLATVYFKNTNNMISRFQQRDSIEGKQVLINTFINANRSYITGLELTTRNKLTKWWDINANLNLFRSQIQIDIPGQQQQEPLNSYFAKLNNTFRLPKNLTLQLSGDYQSRTILPQGGGGGRGGMGGGGPFGGGAQTTTQGFIRPNYGVDAALRFEFLKNKTAAISVNIQDIFRTRVYDAYSFSPFFTQDVFRRRDPQLVRVNFSWRFGKFDASLFKRKNTKAESGIDTGGGMGM